MAHEERDEALSWDGDDEQKPAARVARAAPAPVRDRRATGSRAADSRPAESTSAEQASLGNAALVALGLLAGVYLIETIGWIIGGLRVAPLAIDGLGLERGGFLATMWLAALAPVIWFGATYLVTRGAKPWLRFTVLIAGAIVLLPWPFLMVGVAGR